MNRLLFVLLLLASGCGHKKEGAACTGNEQICAKDKASGLVCRGGKLVAVQCGGPTKCLKYQDHISCDTSVATAGMACMGEDNESACSPDKQHALMCRNGRFETTGECRGPNGCSLLGTTASCDSSIAQKGDPCTKEGAAACSEDKKQMLTCHGGKFDTHRYCRGELGCVSKSDGPWCDESLSQPNDPCGVPGQVVCAVDGKSELVCQGSVFMKSRTCKTGCTISSRPGRPLDCK